MGAFHPSKIKQIKVIVINVVSLVFMFNNSSAQNDA